MTVTTVYATAPGGSGTVNSTNTTYATARTGGTLAVSAANHIAGQTFAAAPDYICYEAVVIFDTSGISDTDVVSGVVLSMDGSSNLSTQDFDVIAASSAYDGGASATTDWVSGASLSGLTTYASWNTSGYDAAYNAFTSAGAAFNSAINRTGNTPMMLYSSRHSNGDVVDADDERVIFTDADAAGTTADPKLDITHGPLAVKATTLNGGSAEGVEPSGAAMGDLLLMIIYNPYSGTAFAPPAGWTEVVDADYNGASGQMGAFWIIRGASAPSYVIGGGNDTSAAVFTYAITGHDYTTPMDATPTTATKTGTNPDSPTITVATAGAMIIVATGDDDSAQAITHPTGFTEVVGQQGCESAYKLNQGAGATGVFSWASASQTWGSMTIAIRPYPASAAAVLPPRVLNINQAVNRASSW